MKKFLKILGIIILTIILAAYLAFLFVLPKKIDLNSYKEMVQRLALEQAHLNIDFSNVSIYTTPALEVGVKIDDLTINLPDNSSLLNTSGVKAKISLPNLFLLTVRVSEIAIDTPQINIDIEKDGSQYKVMRIVEDIINEQKQKQEVTHVTTSNSFFNPAWIKIKIPNVKVTNYSANVNDLSSGHYLTIKGNELKAAYNNMKTFRVKTNAEFLSDENTNITADIDIDSFIPPARELDEDDDPDYRADMGFVNPVETYRDYNLKADISAKIKARMSHRNKVVLKGYAFVEDLTMSLSGYTLPKSYFRTRLYGHTADINTNLYVTKDQNLMLVGLVDYGKKPKMDLSINTKKIYFSDLITVSKAFMDTLHIKNDLGNLVAEGYVTANAKIKTNFKKLKSNGAILVRDGSFANSNIGLLFNKINANILFNDKAMNIVDTYLYVNNSILQAKGQIDEKSVVNVSIFAEKLPLPGLFAAFAPVDLKNAYRINSGTLMLDIKLSGELKKAFANVKTVLNDLNLSTTNNSLDISDENMQAEFASNMKTVVGSISNKNLSILLPTTNSVILNPDLKIIIDEENVSINPMQLKINSASVLNISGMISQYIKQPIINLTANGDLNTIDLKQFLGKDIAQFIDAKGSIPLKFSLIGNNKKQQMICQIKADKLNYITPLEIKSVKGLQSILQAKIDFKGDRLNIRDTGLYTKSVPTPFTDDYDANMQGVKEVATVHGTISKLDTAEPFINQVRINLPSDLQMKITAFENSALTFGGKLLVFGQAIAPKYRGEFHVKDLNIPELFITMKNLALDFTGHMLSVTLEDLKLNESDIQVKADASLVPAATFIINNLNISSNNIDVEKMMKTVDAAMKYVPAANSNAEPADIPIVVRNGAIDMKRILSLPILLNNTTGNISIDKNILYLNNIATSTLGGSVNGDVSVNLLSMLIKAKLAGVNFDVEKTFLELMDMKDTLSGTMAFDTDLSINGAAKDLNEQMKGIEGEINFSIVDGQLGPFGKLENLILAENIRESEFFQTALGGVIDSLTSIQTSHFDLLNGHIIMGDGVATLNPITSVGPVMCMHIAGDMNLLTNEADMKLRARLGSKIADMLGPIAAVNPINLVKATPGLNVAAAKMFAIFCEQLTQEEMNAIPNFEEDKFGKMSTTNFQVVLRGDTQKPLSLIKSFKWLATSDEMIAAESFVETLPPADAENPNATLEELLAAQAEAEKIENENFLQKEVRKVKNIFANSNKKDDK